MCCGRFWTALQLLWSLIYVICGSVQILAGIYFMITIPILHLISVIAVGSVNVTIGLAGGILVCCAQITPRRQEHLVYMAVSILVANLINVIVAEWIYHTDMRYRLPEHPQSGLIAYVFFAVRVADAVSLLISFLDSQFAFCSMHKRSRKETKAKRALRGTHESVADIEYIIPRQKPSKSHTVYNAYAQSWVFEADPTTTSNLPPPAKLVQNGTPKLHVTANGLHNNGDVSSTTHLIDNPVVQIDEASDDSTSNSDRKLCHMRSFSRSTSPILISPGSSQTSLNFNPPIYECLEKLTEPQIYRSRLNSALSNREEDISDYHPPQAVMMRRIESVSPRTEKVQYASLMKELQQAIGGKKEPSISSPQSTSHSTTASDRTQTNSKSSSRRESSRSEGKSSDAEFSKELEAALQLIQDLESPNTIETPSDPKPSLLPEPRPLAVWRNSDASESEKTLSAIGSLGEINASPLNECAPDLQTFKPSTNGKGASIIVHYPDSQSTSGYSSPTHPISNGNTPNWSTTSSINGSNNEIVQPLSYSIHNAKSTTVISLYTPVNGTNAKGKSITLVSISGDNHPVHVEEKTVIPYEHSTSIENNPSPIPSEENSSTLDQCVRGDSKLPPVRTPSKASSMGWKSLLRKKKQPLPRLCPELESAIVKSESLAYLSELELLARHQKMRDTHREIEERVIQQRGMPKVESNY